MGTQHSRMRGSSSSDRPTSAEGQEVRNQHQSSEHQRPRHQDFASNPPRHTQSEGQERSPRDDHQEQPLWDYFHNPDAMAQISKNSQEQEHPRSNNYQEPRLWDFFRNPDAMAQISKNSQEQEHSTKLHHPVDAAQTMDKFEHE